jgi:poly(A) polymerase
MREIEQQKSAAMETVRILQNNGFEAVFAGGCVRDELLGRTPKDYDIATNALPDEVEALFPRTVPIGKAFGVIAVVNGRQTVEVATFRREAGTVDGRHPKTVAFCAAREDALRRDFTINGMFRDPVSNTLHDYVGGRNDLKKRVVAAIGDPEERFREDHLRMLRAIRFSHTLGFTLDSATESAILMLAPLISRISAERIEQELTRILTESLRPGDALKHLLEINLLEHILPELIPMAGQEQPAQFHPEGDVFEHTCLMLNLMKPDSCAAYTPRELAYTVLLHDVGKPPTAQIGPGTDGEPRIRFDGHAQVGAEMTETILSRLRLPTKERKNIVEAIRGHMRFINVQQMRPSKLRKMIGKETFDLELELHRIDCLGSHEMLDNHDFLLDYIEQLENEPALPEPWVRGHDLLDMGLKEGRQIGSILKEAYDAQMEERFANRDELIEWLRRVYSAE